MGKSDRECHLMRLYCFPFTDYIDVTHKQKNSDNDQEIPQSQTADKPVASRGRAT